MHVFLLPGVRVLDLRALRVKLLLEGLEVRVELFLQRLHPEVLQVQEALHDPQVPPERELVLLLGVLEVAVEHLDDGVLAVDLALMVLAQDLDVLSQLLDLGHPHDLPPLVVDLDRVDLGVALLPQLALPKSDAGVLLAPAVLLLRRERLHLEAHLALLLGLLDLGLGLFLAPFFGTHSAYSAIKLFGNAAVGGPLGDKKLRANII
mmetsp:Transcript_37915/g.90048  ORF Transcript_37915/g.90048 Transcript_37915/m.90048 type:complete len:206 (+) Transcript_37915:1336-1953(+)